MDLSEKTKMASESVCQKVCVAALEEHFYFYRSASDASNLNLPTKSQSSSVRLQLTVKIFSARPVTITLVVHNRFMRSYHFARRLG